ncbi:MAG: hypothetical protein Q9214_001987 [Letrouitia sp. 1 TL-2023]
MDNPGSSTLVMFMVQKQFYSNDDAKKLAQMYFHLVKHFAEAPTSRLDQASLFAQQEIDAAIDLGRGPVLESSWPETLAHRIDDVLLENPDAIALNDTQGNTLSYRQMLARSCQIARALLDANVEPKATVVVYQEPSVDWICSLLAVLRIGAVYVPFDINIPLARLETMLETCQPSVILAHSPTKADSQRLGAAQPVRVMDVSSISVTTPASTPVLAKAADPIAILYTSGTTGIPKGVVLSHSGLRNQVEMVTKIYRYGPETVLQQTALSFDLSLDQVMAALCNGGTLVIAPRAIRGDSVALAAVIAKERISYTSATPSEYMSWLQYGSEHLAQSWSWTCALSVGEQYPWKLVEGLQALAPSLGHPLRLFNVYGPTEVTISSSRIELSPEIQSHQRIPAGYTIPNCSVYVVDDNMEPVPVGMPGEVLVGSAGVSMGYCGCDAAVSEKFVRDPFAQERPQSQDQPRAYRTGDRGLLKSDGALEILGRIDGDAQIKLRGIRIEMEDVESTILRTAKGDITAVVASPRGEPPILMAHAVLSPELVEAEDDVRYEFLQRLIANLPLPKYMRPAAIVPVTSIPLTPHRKIDRRTVAQLSVEQKSIAGGGSGLGELSAMETQVREVWESLLPKQVTQLHPDITAQSDFFQVGGNSMLLIKLQRSIRETFDVDLPVIRLFESSTLGAMAAAIKDAADNSEPVTIDWESETAVSNDLLQIINDSSDHRINSDHSDPPQVVVLTGASGFLGQELLRQLLRSPHIRLVHCVAVRDESKLAAFTSSSPSRIKIHPGHLQQPLCGLSNTDAASIFASADAIIHNGADVSFLKSYLSLRAPNVLATKELAKLALPRRIPFHYVSSVATGRVVATAGEVVFPEISLAKSLPPSTTRELKDNYAASKWASEVFLEQVATDTGAGTGGVLPVWIHRPSSITGEGVPETDIMHNLMIYSVLTGKVPVSARWKGVMDFVSVERVAEGILQDVFAEQAQGMPQLTFRHQSGEVVVPVGEMQAYLEKETGAVFEAVGLTEWVAAAREMGLGVLVAEYLEMVEAEEQDVVFQRLVIQRE